MTNNLSADTFGPFTYTNTGSAITITKYTNPGPVGVIGAVEIPATIDGLPITAIGDYAFYFGVGLTGVTIPGTVTSIGLQAFAYCYYLTDVTIPASVTSIGVDAFLFCYALTRVTILLGITSIGPSAFYGCTHLTDITIPCSVASIGSQAFCACSGLTGISIPGSVSSIGDSAFSMCTKLTAATFAGDAPTTGSSVFGAAADGFHVEYYNGASGFTAPLWTDSYGDIYPSVSRGPSPSATWLFAKGLSPTTSLSTPVPKLGGMPLLMAYALNLNPSGNLAATVPKVAVGGGQMSYTYYAANTDVSYLVQASTDLKTWSAAGVSVSAMDYYGNCTATVPLSGGLRFLRLAVSH